MNFSLATLFALAGAVLMALAIFAPRRAVAEATARIAALPVAGQPAPAAARAEPSWTRMIDPAAAGYSVAARREIAAALAMLGTPWASAVLHHALEDETDPAVLLVIARASAEVAAAGPAEGGAPYTHLRQAGVHASKAGGRTRV
jgi:hypothetical protein